MVTIRSAPATDGEEDLVITAKDRECVYCTAPIVWVRTYLRAQAHCFDAAPVPRTGDTGDGWIPGVFDVRGRPRVVLAPLIRHSSEQRLAAQQVMMLHRCTGVRA